MVVSAVCNTLVKCLACFVNITFPEKRGGGGGGSVKSSAVEQLIVINRIQNGFCLHYLYIYIYIYICMYTLYYVCINTQTYSIYFENMFIYLHVYIDIHIINIIYKYI